MERSSATAATNSRRALSHLEQVAIGTPEEEARDPSVEAGVETEEATPEPSSPPFSSPDTPPPSSSPPPASSSVLKRLPIVAITAYDWIDPSNRECCICLEKHELYDKVIRLPCAHHYHPECITGWLQHRNMCPTCRWEFQTDDPEYEEGRLQRMRARKPRYAKHELQRKDIRTLKDLILAYDDNKSMRMPPQCFADKTDLVEYIVANNIVNVIHLPPPVEFSSVEALRNMRVKDLIRAMNEQGVFFDYKDVVEKEDMVQIFLNSGRIYLETVEENEVCSAVDDSVSTLDTSFNKADNDCEEVPFSSPESTTNRVKALLVPSTPELMELFGGKPIESCEDYKNSTGKPNVVVSPVFGGIGGTRCECLHPHSSASIEKLVVYSDSRVVRAMDVYYHGQSKKHTIGNSNQIIKDATTVSTLELGPGEYICFIKVRSSKQFVRGLSFGTNQGNTLGPCGNGTMGEERLVVSDPLFGLCGFQCHVGRRLDSIAFYLEKKEH